MVKNLSVLLLTALTAFASAQNAELLKRLDLLPAPVYSDSFLRKGDRLAICGDSITEQKMYSRLIEDYLTMCVPELNVTVRQYGWSGERAGGFLGRMTNDCLRFNPTIATTCYGMNDHEYRPYEDRIGNTYRQNSEAIIRAFKAHNVRVIQGSPGCVGKMPQWVKSATGTVDDLNVNLAKLRNLGIELANAEGVRFADVYWPMIGAGYAGQAIYGSDFAIAGKDGVHPDWSGQALMAYAFLKAMGVQGGIGELVVDLKRKRLTVSEGHELISSQNGEYSIRSSRYPFCVCLPAQQGVAGYPDCAQDISLDRTIASVTKLIPFHQDLNRFTLKVKGAKTSAMYTVTWGETSKAFSGLKLAQGVNLAEEFPVNPFSGAFSKVDAAIAAKQAFETKQIKEIFHGQQGKTNMEEAARTTEAERSKLAAEIAKSFMPVTHTLKVTAR